MSKKIKLVMDCDAANECDDAFALAYAFTQKNVLDIKAITLAPFVATHRHISAKDSILESKSEANRILRLMGIKNPRLVLKGSEGFMCNGYDEVSPAVTKIISLAKKENITIVCTGVLTNIALALKNAPEIAQNLSIVWLGTKTLLADKFTDSNYSKDKDAFDFVMRSKANITIVPNYVGKFISTSIFELKRNVAVNDIGRHLLDIVKDSNFTEESLGTRAIYDLAPIIYVVHPELFDAKFVKANLFMKEQKKMLASKTVNYVYDMAPNNIIWKEFVTSITKVKNTITPPRVFFISDTHFGSDQFYNIKYTPFKTFEERDEELIRRWNSVVSDKDIVYHIGDFGKYRYVQRLKGHIHLICGNYDKWVCGRDFEWFKNQLLEKGFAGVYKNGLMLDESVLGQKVYLTHRPSDARKNCMNIFGHIHRMKPSTQNGINVSVDYIDYTPISAKDVKKNLEFLAMANEDEETHGSKKPAKEELA